MSDQNANEPVQPPAPAVAAPSTPTPPATTGPWANDVQAAFNDPAIQAQVDAFMREKVQPRMTQLEQEVAGLADAKTYYDDLTSDPGQTWISLTHEILGEDLASKVLDSLNEDPAIPNSVTNEQPPEQTQMALSPDDQELLNEIRHQKQVDSYNNAVNTFVEAKADPDLVAIRFHPFVAAAEGNLDQAYLGYKEWIGEVKAGIAGPGQGDAEVAANAPPTLGDEGGTPPPIQKDYKGDLGAAIDDMWEDLNPPSTMGSI